MSTTTTTTTTFEVGQVVRWTSQAKHSTYTKTGKVVAVIPPSQEPAEVYPKCLDTDLNYCEFDPNGRRHETSYIVQVRPMSLGKAKLYRPLVKNLRAVEETS